MVGAAEPLTLFVWLLVAFFSIRYLHISIWLQLAAQKSAVSPSYERNMQAGDRQQSTAAAGTASRHGRQAVRSSAFTSF